MAARGGESFGAARGGELLGAARGGESFGAARGGELLDSQLPFLGHGVGLRVPHYERALAGGLDVDWVEVVSENFFGGGGRPRALLERLRRDLPLVFHGVSLGIGSVHAPNPRYLAQLKELADQFQPAWLSDHLCWGHFEGRFSHELLPLPYTEEALAHVVERVARAQDVLRRPLLLENVSSYVAFAHSELPEWEFLSEVARRSGCLILLDLNNILVSAHNHGFSPDQYLEGVAGERVQQLHLANHSTRATHKFDDHRGPVPEAVWQLAEAAWRRFGAVSSLIEWDEDVPSWETLRAEQRQAAERARRVLLEPPSAGRAPLSAPAGAPASRRAAAAVPCLEHTQRLFFDAICWPSGVAGFLAHSAAEVRRALQQILVDPAGFGAVERLDVYADAYFYRLLGTLRELFPRLCWLSGDAPFHNLVTDYVLACPSRDPDLRRLGEQLPQFLREHPLGGRWPLLVEIALLEQALNAALDAPDGARLREAELGAMPLAHWPALRLSFSPPTQLLQVRWDLELVQGCYARAEREQALSLTPGAERTLIVGRRGHATYFRSAGAAEGLALARLWQGESFGAACAALERAGAELQPAELVQALQRWLADGLISAITPGATPR